MRFRLSDLPPGIREQATEQYARELAVLPRPEPVDRMVPAPDPQNVEHGRKVCLRFVVTGQPVAKGRPMASVVCGHVHMRTPKKTENYEARVHQAAVDAKPPEWELLDGPIEIEIVAVFERPERLLARSKRTGLLLYGFPERMPHTSRPDLDNVVKAVLDGIDGAGIWRDDARVCRIRAEKVYRAINETACIEVLVSGIPGVRQEEIG